MRTVSFSANNRIALLCGGTEYFPALMTAIEAAKTDIFLETYIFSSDATAKRIACALMNAAKRGVAVHVMTDWFGTGAYHSKRLAGSWLAPPVLYRVFNHRFRRGFARTHRKLCVVDGRVAFVGGLNINDDAFSDDGCATPLPAPRWDFAVQIYHGPIIAHIDQALRKQWQRLHKLSSLQHLHFSDLLHNFQRWCLIHQPCDSILPPMVAGLVVQDNLHSRGVIAQTYMDALACASKSALLANPYFAPGRKLRQALISAAQRGVQVTLLLGVGHYCLQDAVTRWYYPKLMRAGIKIVEYRKTALHAKVAVIDDHWASVGSSNFDGFSLLLNHEANLIIKDMAFSSLLRSRIEEGIVEGVELSARDFMDLPWYCRIWCGLAFLGYRAVMRLFSIGNKG